MVDEGQQSVDAAAAEPAQQTPPAVEGLRDMTPAPEPLTGEQQQLNTAASATMAEVLGKMNSAENGASNSMANAILNDPVALEQLVQLTMAEITGTKAEQRKAVKEALNRMFSSEVSESVDTASVAEYDNINTSQEGVTDYVTRTENDNGGNGWNTEVNSGILSSQGPANSDRDVRPGDPGRISGGNGEGTLHAADSEGRELAPEISERIRGTAVADGDGRPLSEIRPYGERASITDTPNQSAPGAQQPLTEQNPGTVGAMQSQFKHEVKQSKVYGNTYQNTPYADVHDIGRAAKKADPNIDQYDVITEAESVHEAELRTETGRDRLAEHRALMKKDGWTGADNDTAMRLLTVYRREGKKDRFLELSRKQRQMGTQAGQMVQSFANYSREDDMAMRGFVGMGLGAGNTLSGWPGGIW